MTKIIAIAGGTASGKTGIRHILQEALGDQAVSIPLDAYYEPYYDLSFEERLKKNYDHPNAFDLTLLIEHLTLLMRGEAIALPVYDYVQYTRTSETIRLEPRPVILLEGLFVLYYARLLPLLDLKVYIQADADERLIRRIRRDQKERGRSLESILTQYIDTIKPMHEAFIAPTKKNADIIIPRGAENTRGIDLLINHVKKLSGIIS